MSLFLPNMYVDVGYTNVGIHVESIATPHHRRADGDQEARPGHPTKAISSTPTLAFPAVPASRFAHGVGIIEEQPLNNRRARRIAIL